MSDQETKGGEQKERRGKLIVAACIAVIAVLLIAVIVLLMQRDASEKPEETRRNVVVNQENAEQIVDELSDWEPVQSGHYEVTMNSEWRFPDGKSASENAYVENAQTNTNDVFFDINLIDTEDLIYSSPVIPLGSHLEDITLDQELAAGTYDCVLTYHLVDENQETLSTLKMGLTIIIEN